MPASSDLVEAVRMAAEPGQAGGDGDVAEDAGGAWGGAPTAGAAVGGDFARSVTGDRHVAFDVAQCDDLSGAVAFAGDGDAASSGVRCCFCPMSPLAAMRALKLPWIWTWLKRLPRLTMLAVEARTRSSSVAVPLFTAAQVNARPPGSGRCCRMLRRWFAGCR